MGEDREPKRLRHRSPLPPALRLTVDFESWRILDAAAPEGPGAAEVAVRMVLGAAERGRRGGASAGVG